MGVGVGGLFDMCLLFVFVVYFVLVVVLLFFVGVLLGFLVCLFIGVDVVGILLLFCWFCSYCYLVLVLGMCSIFFSFSGGGGGCCCL